MSRRRRSKGGYTQNHGKPGVVYILENDAFPHLLKIGQTTRSVAVRVRELNEECGTENPGYFRSLYQKQTVDCGRAEELAHQNLREKRFRKEYFSVSLNEAREAVDAACSYFNRIEEENCRRRATEVEAEHRRKQEEEARQRLLTLEEERVKAAAERRRQEEKRASAELAEREAEERRRRRLDELRPYVDQQRMAATPDLNLDLPNLPNSSPASENKDPTRGSAFAVSGLPDSDQKTRYAFNGLTEALIIFFGVVAISVIVGSILPSPKAAPTDQGETPDHVPYILARYAHGYSYPKQFADDETILVEVSALERDLTFLYKSTELGERIMERDFSPERIRSNMQKTACGKEEIRNFLKLGANVFYTLASPNRQEVTVRVACQQ